MDIEVRFFASIAEQMGTEATTVAAELPCTVADIWRAASGNAPADRVLCAVNARSAALDQAVCADDVVAFFPPVTGG